MARQFENQVALITGGSKGIEGLHAIKRMGQPEEVAEAVLFLASAKASFGAGHPLLVDGGYVAR
jgi:NAD(P)-dependent dehydrogenase (short-subunit alcohol dehydrogenase family)